MTTYKEYINPEVEFKVRQRGKKNKKQSIKKQSIKGGPVTEDMIKYGKRKRYEGGGRATHGYGKAYLKGGKVK